VRQLRSITAVSQANIMLARYYSSSLDRFLAVDPSRRSVLPTNPQTWNRYSYARNNPLARIDPDGKTDIYIGGGWDARSQIVSSYANQHPSAPGRTVAYFTHDQVKQAIAFANASLKNGEPMNIIGHSWGAASALKVAAGVKGTVNTLVGVDPVGKPFTFGSGKRPENVANMVTVNATPSSPNLSDTVASTGRGLLCGGTPAAFDQADVSIDVDANHEDFETLYTTDGSDGQSASDVVGQTYQRKSGGKSGVSGGPGYVDSDGTHWSSARSVEAY